MKTRTRVSMRTLAKMFIAAAIGVLTSCLQLGAQTFANVCPNSSSLFSTAPPGRLLDKSWKKNYPILIYNMDGERAELDAMQAKQDADLKEAIAERAQNTIDAELADPAATTTLQAEIKSRQSKQSDLHSVAVDAKAIQIQRDAARSKLPWIGKLFWKEAGNTDPLTPVSPINNPGFIANVFTTEKVLVLVCNAKFGDGSSMSSDVSVAVTGGDENDAHAQSMALTPVQLTTMDRLYVLDATKVTNNSLERVIFSVDTGTGGIGADTVATAVLERHKVIHFSAGGGLLAINAPSMGYSVISVPTVFTTTTTASSTTLTNGANTGSSSSTMTGTASGAASYVLGQKQSTQQLNGVAGMTVYPFGFDTFPSTKRSGLVLTHSAYSLHAVGIFVGTSVSSFGNFTVAPSYEVFPGVQLFAGLTIRTKTTLSPGITACTGYGNSPSFTSAPTTTNTSTTSATANGVTTVTTNTTTTTTTATSGCSNGDRASIFSGTTAPTQSSTVPAFSFGLLLNTNLLKAFSGFGK